MTVPHPRMEFERQARAAGHAVIAGVDEAGRGPWAGPVFAAAVVLPPDYTHTVLNDSKQLSEARRASLYEELTADPHVQWAVASATAEEIDRLNILQATHLAMRRAVEALPVTPGFLLIDGRPVKSFQILQNALVKGDSRSLSIAAASILAKVSRDRIMLAMDRRYPQYGFASHKGYGTAAHQAALAAHGPCPEHRKSFAPIKALLLRNSGLLPAPTGES